jgi:hypothetical protein
MGSLLFVLLLYFYPGEQIIGDLLYHVATKNLLHKHGILQSVEFVSPEKKGENIVTFTLFVKSLSFMTSVTKL